MKPRFDAAATTIHDDQLRREPDKKKRLTARGNRRPPTF
jgi:hypothetical protein